MNKLLDGLELLTKVFGLILDILNLLGDFDLSWFCSCI